MRNRTKPSQKSGLWKIIEIDLSQNDLFFGDGLPGWSVFPAKSKH
jgi:hypothetical protein